MRYVLFICSDPTGEPYDPEHDNVGEWAHDSVVLDFPTRARFIPVDLTDAADCRARLGPLRGVTRIVYAALFEKPDLGRGWLEANGRKLRTPSSFTTTISPGPTSRSYRAPITSRRDPIPTGRFRRSAGQGRGTWGVLPIDCVPRGWVGSSVSAPEGSWFI